MIYVLVILFFIILIGLVLASIALSVGVGVVIAVFVGIYTAIKNCVLGIHRSISNPFLKILLYIVIGLFIAAIIGVPAYFIAMSAIG